MTGEHALLEQRPSTSLAYLCHLHLHLHLTSPSRHARPNSPPRVAVVMAGGIPLAVQHMYMQMAVETGGGASDGCDDGFVLPWERHGSHAQALPRVERTPLHAAARGAPATGQGLRQGRGQGQGRGRGRSGSTDKARGHTSASRRGYSAGDTSRRVAHVPARAGSPPVRISSSHGRGQAHVGPALQRYREQEQAEQPRWR